MFRWSEDYQSKKGCLIGPPSPPHITLLSKFKMKVTYVTEGVGKQNKYSQKKCDMFSHLLSTSQTSELFSEVKMLHSVCRF
jgi:hypothetical protein